MFLQILYLFVISCCVRAANILYIDPVNSPSHHIWNEVLVGGLLERGHNVTLLGRFDTKIRNENYTILKMTGDLSDFEDDIPDLIYEKKSAAQELFVIWRYILHHVNADLKSDAFHTLTAYPRDTFDLIIMDIGTSHYCYPLIKYFRNPPSIAVSPFALPPYILDLMGSHFHSYYPVYVTSYSDQMSFWERLANYGMYVADYFLQNYYMSLMEDVIKEAYGDDFEPLIEGHKHLGILLANYDPILDFPQPLPPYIIPVGGLHVKRSGELTADLQTIMDESKNGIIYCSFGTNIQWSSLQPEFKNTFLGAFSKLQQTVLWKYDGDDLKSIPQNVIVRKWFPQSNVLGHKNVKLVISHGGGLSSHETVYYGIPVVAIPFFLDQKHNAAKLEAKNVGKQLQSSNLTEQILYEAIIEVLNNPKYRKSVQTFSTAFRDRKETPLERAIFWVDQALKQKDLSYLWPRSREMGFWQRQNFDIFTVLAAVAALALFLLYVIFKYTLRLIFKERVQRKLKKQ